MAQAKPIDEKLTIKWLNNFIMLAQWDKKLPFHTVTLLADQNAYQEFLTEARSESTDQVERTEEETAVSIARGKLLAAVESVPTVKELFSAETDPFKDAPSAHLQLLAEVSDITVKPPQTIYSRNGTLIAITEALRPLQQLDVDSLIVDWLNKYFTLIETREPVAKMLFDLAESPHWYVVLAALREDRDYVREEEQAVRETVRDWQTRVLTTPATELLFKPGHLSRAPKRLIKVAWNQRQLFDEARKKLPEAAPNQPNDPVEERRQVAIEAWKLFEERAKSECDDIRADLNVLVTVGQHYIGVRKFAKFDGFVYTWPDLARLAMSNYSALKKVEDLLINRKPLPADADPDVQELYGLCEKNDRLIRFLRLRPYFSEINENELRIYQPLARVTVAERAQTVASGGGADFAPKSPPPTASFTVKQVAVRSLNITLDQYPFFSDKDKTYTVVFSEPKGNQQAVTFATFKFPFSVQKVLENILGAMGVTSDAVLQDMLTELFSSGPAPAETRMARGGLVLEKQFLHGEPRNNIAEILIGHEPLRLLVRSDLGDVHYLPWEWLPNPTSPLLELLLSSPDHSVVRVTFSDEDITPMALVPPLRVLSIIPDPPSGQRFTAEATIRGLERAIAKEGAKYEALLGSKATLENVTVALDTFNPQIVHFEGHVHINPEGAVSLIFSPSASPPVFAEQFSGELKERGVQLLVLGKNPVSRLYANIGAAAAFQLSRGGLPAVIAPMRAIDETSATLFTTSFYTAFLSGNPLETALHSARRALASAGGDWSVFALFADPARLDDFQLLRETA